MPAHNALVGGLKPPQKSKSSKNGVIMPVLGDFLGIFFMFIMGGSPFSYYS
jgi:hypothetical protein